MTSPWISCEFTRLVPEAIPPLQAFEYDAGWDLHVLEPARIPVDGYALLRSGIAIAVPGGYYARIVGRSSSMYRRGLLVIEGVLDSGYRGECMSAVFNTGREGVVELEPGDSVSQIIVSPVPLVAWQEVLELSTSDRGVSGYGSSGR